MALVTGASSGIGEAVAVALAGRGAHVTAVARREDRLEQTAARCRESGGVAEIHPADLSERSACEAVVAAVEEAHGRLDIVVNNAGIPMRRHATDLTMDDVERVVGLNLLGTAAVTLAALPGMVARNRGSIVNVGSVAGALPNPREAAYAAAKAGVEMFSHALAVDLAGTGVHVGVIAPGPIDTEIWDKDEEAAIYRGKLFPPTVVADAVVRMIERERVHVTVPRLFGIAGAIYPLVQRPMRWGLARFGARGPAERGG